MITASISLDGRAIVHVSKPGRAKSLRKILTIPHKDRKAINKTTFLILNPEGYQCIPEIQDALVRARHQLRMFE